MIRAGELRHKITIQSPAEVSDGRGGVSRTWDTHAKAYAAIEPLRSEDVFDQQAIATGAQVRIRTRGVSSVTTTMRVLFGTRVYEIVGVVDIDERGRELRLNCRENV